jgi:hypothetical protein
LAGYPAGSAASALSVDVRRTPQAVVDGVEPARLPLGRWRGATVKALVLSQQFAATKSSPSSGRVPVCSP